MLTLQVLPTRTFIVKLFVCALIDPESTSIETSCSRAGGAMSAIAAVFALLLVGQPFGPGAVAPWVPFGTAAAMLVPVSAISNAAQAMAGVR
jgi:hypothetical protein